MKHVSIYLVIFSLLTLSGCAKLLNPYEESFGCPGGDVGSCDDMETAYNKSLNSESFSPMVTEDRREEEPDMRNKSNFPIYSYRKQHIKEVKGLIEDPITPMIMPSKKMRLLVLGYEDVTKDYYGHRYIYFIAEEERWAMPFNIMGGSSDHAESLFK